MITTTTIFPLLLYITYSLTHSAALKSRVKAARMTAILDDMINKETYDKRLRPNYNGKAVEIKIGFWTTSIDPIDVMNMDYTIDLFIRQEWVDPRLNHHLNETIQLSHGIVNNIWTPDTYFVNAKTSRVHRVTNLNVMVMLAPNGLIKYNTRVTVKAACNLDLRLFPIDKQTCPLILESYGYHMGHIIYRWETNSSNGISFVPKHVRLMPQYQIVDVRLLAEIHQYVVGNFSALRANFSFVRYYSYFLSHIYGTSSVIVVISWMAFFLPRDQTAARVGVGVTSLLTEVTVIDMLNSAMPKVSYVKSIDKFLMTCLFYVFLSLAEYCIVLVLDRRYKKLLKRKKKEKEQEQLQEKIQEKLRRKNWWVKSACPSATLETKNHAHVVHSTRGDDHHPIKPSKKTSKQELLDWLSSERFIEFIDTAALVVFPFSFAMFQICYWLSGIQESSDF
ncbi:gamma-aminobutyric acid receptor subunit beta-like [Actinia tenebrosa]|uniref:Gamma-aminobutyric acid receptor subunit beta n=1 Tax=Actinia tenebrosa TaxID=6105 RepID=A0A6P8I901_ACTTE|nr:gamma-aminobutyric acid receptor subunit beta-like [Actinia tenebrosa]